MLRQQHADHLQPGHPIKANAELRYRASTYSVRIVCDRGTSINPEIRVMRCLPTGEAHDLFDSFDSFQRHFALPRGTCADLSLRSTPIPMLTTAKSQLGGLSVRETRALVTIMKSHCWLWIGHWSQSVNTSQLQSRLRSRSRWYLLSWRQLEGLENQQPFD